MKSLKLRCPKIPPQTIEVIAIALICPPELDSKTLLLKIPPLSVKGPREIKSVLTRKPPPLIQLSQYEKILCRLLEELSRLSDWNYSPCYRSKHIPGTVRVATRVNLPFILLNGHVIKLLSKIISFYLQICAVLRPYQKNFFVQWLVASIETQEWSKYKE